jgi:putative membrane protein insertion efficiency factor
MSTARRVLRQIVWWSGAPARGLLLAAIRLYRAALSGWLGGQCRYYPSCSRYAEEAIRTLGATRGTLLAGWRILRCNPFGAGGVDPVPASDRMISRAAPGRQRQYGGVIQGAASSPRLATRSREAHA